MFGEDERWFRVTCVLPFAAIPARADSIPPLLDVKQSTPHADRARAALSRVSRRDADIREALLAMYDGMVQLERELEELRRNLRLAAAGIDLKPELVNIGGDGVSLQRASHLREGQHVHLYISLAIRDSPCLLSIPATVCRAKNDSTELLFGPMSPEQRDRIVAFTFQQQGRERRRVLDAATRMD